MNCSPYWASFAKPSGGQTEEFLHRCRHRGNAGRGKTGILIGLGSAIITGASVALVNFFWNVGQPV